MTIVLSTYRKLNFLQCDHLKYWPLNRIASTFSRKCESARKILLGCPHVHALLDIGWCCWSPSSLQIFFLRMGIQWATLYPVTTFFIGTQAAFLRIPTWRWKLALQKMFSGCWTVGRLYILRTSVNIFYHALDFLLANSSSEVVSGKLHAIKY